ncbi:transcriptional regulator [Planotetraspora thailandica]|uniref:Transcriptional regulator n=1 Tax=Planotetraspora thailandica TaxID=487172 RepID=A0A8J3Y2G4_9ACTN|nr:ROK family transcriptional regulator [Planotetraspora thailandica]GII59690.1 transcriptional regulator [Planotetraspora thailandica]
MIQRQPSVRSAGNGGQPLGHASLRRANLALVLRHLRDEGPCSRADIADSTGLHRATVSSLMAELLERGLVREVGTERAGAIGRPRRAVALDGSHVGALGMEINVDYIAVHGTDLSGRVLVERRIGFDAMGHGPDRSLVELGRVTRRVIGDMKRAGASPGGIVVGVPGLVDSVRGIVAVAPNLGWHGLPLAERLRAELGALQVPVFVDNDANLAALAEYAFGVAAGTPDMISLTGEVGVGGGIIVGGRLLGGADGFAGEVGHLPVDPAGERCGCGRIGCWETKVGFSALVRVAVRDQTYGLDGAPAPDPDERATEIARDLAAGDRRMADAVAEVGRWLGLGGSILANLFNPRVIVVGGYFARLAEQLIPPAQAELEQLVVAGPAARCRFLASDLGFGAASRGAASMVIDHIMEDPTAIGSAPIAHNIAGQRI